MTKNKVLNQPSALTTFKIKEGNYYNAPVEKGIFALLLREQYELRKSYKENLNETLEKLNFEEEQKEQLLDNLYALTTKETVTFKDISPEDVKEVAKEIYTFKNNLIISQTRDLKEQKKLKGTKEFKNLENLLEKNENLTLKEKQLFVMEIKKYCKEISLEKHLKSKTIDFTSLAKSLNSNITRLKKEMKEAVKTVLEFNYINRKNIDAEVVASLLSYIEIYYDKENKTNWMNYQIPEVILELLLLPTIYVPLEEVAVSQISGAYTMRMYGLLKDHLLKGNIELDKEEIFNFFMLPKSYENKTNLEKKFLIPTLEEVEKVSGIKTTYEFKPKNKYSRIVFYPKLKKKVQSDKLEIIDRTENEKQPEKELTNFEKKIKKAKRNIYVSKSWNKRVDNKIEKILMEEGEEFAFYILDAVYENLNTPIETTLVQYINGIIKKSKQLKNTKIKLKLKEDIKIENVKEILVKKEEVPVKLSDFTEKEIEKAIKKVMEKENLNSNFFETIRKKSESIFFNTIKAYLTEGE